MNWVALLLVGCAALLFGVVCIIVGQTDVGMTRQRELAWHCASTCVAHGGKAAECRVECEDLYGVR